MRTQTCTKGQLCEDTGKGCLHARWYQKDLPHSSLQGHRSEHALCLCVCSLSVVFVPWPRGLTWVQAHLPCHPHSAQGPEGREEGQRPPHSGPAHCLPPVPVGEDPGGDPPQGLKSESPCGSFKNTPSWTHPKDMGAWAQGGVQALAFPAAP